jgi:histidyl-tRNA synthetase
MNELSEESPPPGDKAVKAWENMARNMVEVVRRNAEVQATVLAAARQTKIAAWSFVAVVAMSSAVVIWSVQTSNQKASRERAAQSLQTDQLRIEVRAAIGAQTKRQAAEQAEEEAFDAVIHGDRDIAAKAEVAKDLQAEAAEAELAAVKVLLRPSPKVIEHLQKRAAEKSEKK